MGNGFSGYMKTKKKRTETFSETTTIVFLKNSNAGAQVNWCERCMAEVIWISSTELGLFDISDIAEIGRAHVNGNRFCSRSVINEIRNGK
jgi:hypothetical protein